MDLNVITELKQKLPSLQYAVDEPLKNHTSFRIGGPAKLMLFPTTAEELKICLSTLPERPLLLGAGTNILAPDEGLDRPVICLREQLNGLRLLPGDRIEAEAGVTLARLAVFAREHSLTGLEFAHGIPGTVGGGVYMNAGAYGGEVTQVAERVTVLDRGELREILCTEDTFGYRTSLFEREDLIIVSAVFRLTPGDGETIGETMRQLMEKRKGSQPLDLPSAGSAFKRPVGGYAAALIDQAGLRGFAVGDAQVSEKHTGFIVNRGSATAAEVRQLMAHVQEVVEEQSGIQLQPEVRIW